MMIDLPYSLVIEATADSLFFGFYSPDLDGFTGVGHSLEDCLYQARWGIREPRRDAAGSAASDPAGEP